VRRRQVDAGDLPEVPERLRRFNDRDWSEARVTSTAAYVAARRRWLRARRGWEAANGVTLREVDDAVWAAALAAGGLEALGEAAAFIEDDEPDPRFRAVEVEPAEVEAFPLGELEPVEPEPWREPGVVRHHPY
jgi:hypothetical protein